MAKIITHATANKALNGAAFVQDDERWIRMDAFVKYVVNKKIEGPVDIYSFGNNTEHHATVINFLNDNVCLKWELRGDKAELFVNVCEATWRPEQEQVFHCSGNK